MSSIRRVRASRANGARSRGPVTPEGKERSARNALRHGILSQTVVLEEESSDAFRAALAAYVGRFHPVDDVDLAFIEEMATAFWRQRRCWGIEARMMQDAVAAATAADPLGRFAQAFSALAASPQLGLMHRYETRLHMMFQRALTNFLLVRDAAIPNEPSPGIGQTEETGTAVISRDESEIGAVPLSSVSVPLSSYCPANCPTIVPNVSGCNTTTPDDEFSSVARNTRGVVKSEPLDELGKFS
jgi:hypothetical protein